MPDPRPVLVTWRDTTTQHAGWLSIEDASKLAPSVVRTVGFVVRRSKREIVLVQSVSNDGDALTSIVIPRDWVQSVVRL